MLIFLCIVNAFTQYPCVKILKDKKDKAVLHGFIEILNQIDCGLIKERNIIMVTLF